MELAHAGRDGAMTESNAMADIGPTGPSRGKIISHAREVAEFARNAIRCAEQSDNIAALQWMDRAHKTSTFAESPSE